jgi:hypothetical protein
MAKFIIESKSAQSAEKAFEKIKNFLENDPELKKLDPKIKCTFDSKNLCGEAKGGQFKAAIKVVENGPAADITVSVDLAFILSPFKNKVQETLQKKLTKALA